MTATPTIGCTEMTNTSTEKAPRVEKQERLAAYFVLICAVGSGVMAVLNIMKGLEAGWPLSHPWSTIMWVVLPVMLLFLAFTFLSVLPWKRIFAVVTGLCALAAMLCGALGLVA